MSTIKNLVKTFKERQAVETIPTAVEQPIQPVVIESVELESVVIIEEKEQSIAVTDKKQIKSPVETKTHEKKQTQVKSNKSEKQADNGTTILPNFSLTDDFFMSLNEQTFSYEKSKFAYIDKKLYEVLMTLKRKKDVKNISLLINAALAQFIEQNKEEIKKIFMDDLF